MNRTWTFGSSALLALGFVGGLGIAHAQDSATQTRVGVVVTLSVNATPEQTERLTTTLGRALEAKFSIDAMVGDELPEVEVADDCIARPGCVRDLARDLGVDQVLLLTVVRVGERFQVAITWGDGTDGRTVSRVSIDIDVEQQDPEPVFAVYASRLLPDAERRPERPDDGARDGAGRDGLGDGGSALERGATARHMSTGAWIAAGLGAAFLAGGAGFGLSARSAYNDLESRDCRVVACADADIDRVASRARTADVLFGAAVVAGALSAVFYYRSGRKGARPRGAEVRAFAGSDQLGLSVGGRF